MILKDFTLTHTLGNNLLNTTYFAEVIVTTKIGALWWKKKFTERKKIFRHYAESWRFQEGGGHTPGLQAEGLEQAWRAQVKLAGGEGK